MEPSGLGRYAFVIIAMTAQTTKATKSMWNSDIDLIPSMRKDRGGIKPPLAADLHPRVFDQLRQRVVAVLIQHAGFLKLAKRMD